MILVTGGTGFIGTALIRNLVEAGYPVRTLIRPSKSSPSLPRGVPVDIAMSSLNDERGLRAAMVGIDTIFHLASGEWRGTRASLLDIDVRGTRAVVQAAAEARVDRIFYISHIGADRASAYPVFKAKAIAEEFIRRSGIDHTILRSAIVFGAGDGFTTGLARLLSSLPYMFIMPGNGKVLLQPIWVEDLVTCLTWAMEDESTRNMSYEIGGPEYLAFTDIIQQVMQTIHVQKRLVRLHPPYLRVLTIVLDSLFPGLPVSVYWLDYLAANRTTGLDTVPRVFGLLPARLSHRLAYLEGQEWREPLLRSLFRRQG